MSTPTDFHVHLYFDPDELELAKAVANEAAERARPPMRLTLVAGCAADFRHVDKMLAWPCWRLQDKET